MQINPLVTVGGLTTTSSNPSPSSSTSSSSGSNPAQDTQSMFLKLLTTQLENQTPFDPADPMQFTQELVQFNMLDQLTQINSTLQQLSGTATSANTNSTASIPGEN